LFAIGAPSKAVVVPLLVAYNFLLYGFGVGVRQSAGLRRARRVASVGMIGKEVFGMVVTLFFPMHTRAVLAAGGGTLTDEMHRDLTLAGTLFMLTALVAGATAFGKRFRLYTIATILLFVAGGIASFGDAPRMAANLPTPWQGVTERILAYGYMLWVALLAIGLLRAHGTTVPRHEEKPTMIPEQGAR
jgi:hypothetical protein